MNDYEDEEEYIEYGRCEECGAELIEHKEWVDGDKHFLPLIWLICRECER